MDSNQSDIVKALRAAGAYVQSTASLGSGYPDLTVGYRGKTILMEVKRPGGDLAKKLTDDQELWIARWCGGKVWLVSTPEEALQALEESV